MTTHYETRYETLEERARRLGVPFIPARPVHERLPGNPVVAICGACYRDVHQVEGYSCGRGDCPISPPPFSMTGMCRGGS